MEYFDRAEAKYSYEKHTCILVSIKIEANLGYCFDTFDYVLKPITVQSLSEPVSRLTGLLKKKINKIVVIDDNEEEIKSYVNSIREEGIKVKLLNPNESLISRIIETQPDVVIINLTILETDAMKLTHQLKSKSETRHIPVLIGLDNQITESERKSLNESIEQIILKSEQHPIEVFQFVSSWLEIQKLAQTTYTSASDLRIESKSNEKIIKNALPANNQQFDLNILIVDDDSSTLFTLAEIVRSANCNPILASNGKECLEILEEKIPDLIFLDIIMPEMDGFKTIKQIKKNDKWADIPVFAVTAKAMKEDNEIIIKHGFSDYIPKPVNPSFVTHKIQTLIAQLKTT